jgi:hypothetical protein
MRFSLAQLLIALTLVTVVCWGIFSPIGGYILGSLLALFILASALSEVGIYVGFVAAIFNHLKERARKKKR